ncbi:hypothetical protein OHB39_11825 [Streptomyces sp. NBC_00047]|uniref:hypothetical protein n=1 Tax=Streptomyces sp. NBC_00047 TaxID=2975627 RepID=UPI002251B43C|nr:hypothetical protein [Streptomyces sp. NBC_00047]MCX5608250.1 hypothetical protein [Streptomyces sp. NBC_00047]
MTLFLTASALILLATLSYSTLCVASPFGTCRKCRGFGYLTRTDRKGRLKHGKDCRRCHTTGKRIRIGRWIYNRAVHVHRAGTR